MRVLLLLACIVGATCSAWAQQPSSSAIAAASKSAQARDAALKDLFEAKIKTEWEALKNKDKKSYGQLLAEDYEGVELDGQGERSKLQAIDELVSTNVFNYTLWGLKVISLNDDAAFVVYEVTMQFPPTSTLRYSRIYVGEVWVRRSGEWKELHYQETRVK